MSFLRLVVFVFLCSPLLLGCFPGSNDSHPIEFYTLDYRPPAPRGIWVDATIRVDRFSAGRLYDSNAMVYRPEAYRVVVYNYHKWRTSPGDMASDYLLRDFQNSGLFSAVFSYRQPEAVRFVVSGVIEEFTETKEDGAWKAVLDLRVTLLDRTQPGVSEQVMFQKRYRVVQAMTGESPDAFAAGISAAMAQASSEIVMDVNDAIRGKKTAVPGEAG